MNENNNDPCQPEVLACISIRFHCKDRFCFHSGTIGKRGRVRVAIDWGRVEVESRKNEGETKIEKESVQSPKKVEWEGNILHYFSKVLIVLQQ